MSPPKPWTFAAQDLTLSASRIFFPSFPSPFYLLSNENISIIKPLHLISSAWSFGQRGELKHYFTYLWHLERCSSSWSGAWGSVWVPSLPSHRWKMKVRSCLSCLSCSPRTESDLSANKNSSRPHKRTFSFFSPKSAIKISSNTGLLADNSLLEKPCATEVSEEWEN